MIRIFAFLGGLGFVTALLVAALIPRDATEISASERFHKEAKEISFASDGPFGKFDHYRIFVHAYALNSGAILSH